MSPACPSNYSIWTCFRWEDSLLSPVFVLWCIFELIYFEKIHLFKWCTYFVRNTIAENSRYSKEVWNVVACFWVECFPDQLCQSNVLCAVILVGLPWSGSCGSFINAAIFCPFGAVVTKTRYTSCLITCHAPSPDVKLLSMVGYFSL